MTRWWWLVALLALSIGFNIGLLVTVVFDEDEEEPSHASAVEEGGDGEERAPAGAAGPAAPDGRDGPRGRRSARAAEELSDRLGLTGAEREEFTARHREFFATLREKRRELEGLRRELRHEIVSETPDRARIERLLERSSRLTTEMELAFVDHVMMARRVLDGDAERRYLDFVSRLAAEGREPGGRRWRRRRPGRR